MNRPLIRPGRHLSQPPVHAPHAALLIDFDNVTLGIQKDLTKELRTLLNSDIIKGKVAVQRAYADWRRYPQYIVPLSESSIDLIFAPAFGSSKKNATDIRLAIDAIELVFTRPEIGMFILLSGDSDFSTMVIKLKEYGKYVIGVGIRESASDLLIQNCDEYYSYNDLAGLTKEVDTPSTQRDPWELAAEAVAQMARNGDVMRSDRLKQVMQQIDSNFDERNAGFNRFSKFVIEAGQKGIVQLTKLDNGQYEVGPGSVAPPISAAATPAARTRAPVEAGREEPASSGGRSRDDGARRGRGRRGRGGRERTGAREGGATRGRTSEGGRESPSQRPVREERGDPALTLARAFQLMSQALSEFRSPVGQEALRLRMVAMNGREDPLLDAARFQRLLRQANDAEVADVRKVGDDDYEIALQRSSSRPQLPPAPREESTDAPAAGGEAPAAEPVSSGTRENGQRLGLRFRRGSRGPMRAADIPRVGMVSIEPFAEPELLAPPAELASVEAETEAPTKPKRRAPARRKRVTATPAQSSPAEVDESAAPAPPKRPRARPRKKPE
ncbi:MAG TPA: NYN domain-containing protein [Gemmatimonadales bacterium]|nr:NYN domain-containing protein [Gemmatimonadales bacterium]